MWFPLSGCVLCFGFWVASLVFVIVFGVSCCVSLLVCWRRASLRTVMFWLGDLRVFVGLPVFMVWVDSGWFGLGLIVVIICAFRFVA